MKKYCKKFNEKLQVSVDTSGEGRFEVLSFRVLPKEYTPSHTFNRWVMGIRFLCILGLPDYAMADDLDNAFSSLVEGREYQAGFPNDITRNTLVDDFVGAAGHSSNRPALLEAVKRAIDIRKNEPPEPDSFTGKAPRSIQAKVIAWEALESLSTGYLYAGNRDLLDAVRVSYPGSNSEDDTRELPAEESTEFPGTSQKQITYARLYFLQGIKDVLEFIAEDTTGKLRAGSDIYGDTVPHYVSFDEEERDEVLLFPKYDDPNFGSEGSLNREAAQSVAYLYGSSMERYGLAAVAYADQLWRSAFAGPGAGAKRTDTEKNQMLDHATDILRSSVQAQFLASLPLAAQLNDGVDGSANEFQQAKMDQARVSVTDAIRLREQILAGEKPTQTALVSAWDTQSIEDQISLTRDAFDAARIKWTGDGGEPVDGSVAFELQREESAQSLNADRQISLRNSLESQLVEITGIDPDEYGNLRKEEERNAYLDAVQLHFDTLINSNIESNFISEPDFIRESDLKNGSLMSIQALRLIQTIREIIVQKARIDTYGQKMQIELERNGDVNATLVINGLIYGAIDAAIQLASANEVQVHTAGTASGTTWVTDPGAGARALQAILRAARVATETVQINSTNSKALISNLLIEQQIAIDQLPVIALNSDIAGAELLRLLNKARRLVEDHAFFQDITNDLWYRDPSLPFKLEKVEEEYQGLMQGYRIELYKLARMIETTWTERFQNPVKNASGSVNNGTLNNGSFDGFTEAESVFSVANHVQGETFSNALKA
jgi:hypothetical protein